MSDPQTYAELQASLLAWIDNTDANVNAAECIGLAEARLSRLLNTPDMEAATTLTSAVTPIPLPADFRQVRSLVLTHSPDRALEPLSVAELLNQYPTNAVGDPCAYAVKGLGIILGPSPTATVTIKLAYKAAIPALSDANPTNWLLTKHPDLYLAASLAMAELRGWNDSRLPMLKSWYDELLSEVNEEGKRARYGNGPIHARASVRGFS
jgi:hypothetical protein